MSNAGKFLLAFFIVVATAVTGLAFVAYGQEIALRVGLLAFGFVGLLVLAKLAGNKDFWVYVVMAGLIGYVVISIASGNFGSRLVSNQMTDARYISINGENFAMRDNEFGTFPNSTFVAQGTVSENFLTWNGQTFEVNGFFDGWPIVATGNGQKLTISFAQ